MIRSFKFRLYPTRAQEARLVEILDRCRELYNAAIEQRSDAWRRCGKSLSAYDQNRELKTLDGYGGLKRVAEQVVARVHRAFAAFFRRVKSGGAPGYPRFKNAARYRSFETDVGIRADAAALSVCRMRIRWKAWALVPPRDAIRCLRVIREADGWFAVLVCDMEPEPLQPTGAAVGIDVGLLTLVATSDGEKIAPAKHLVRAAKKLARAQRRVSRRRKGSRRRRKAVASLAKHHQRVARSRAHFLHGISKKLVAENDVIAAEDIVPMVSAGGRGAKGHGFRRAIQDASWGILFSQIAYKAESAGRTFVRVDPRGTSQECSACGHKQQKTLQERTHRCAACGLVLDRDVNAAHVILNRALRALRGGDGLSGAPTNREQAHVHDGWPIHSS